MSTTFYVSRSSQFTAEADEGLLDYLESELEDAKEEGDPEEIEWKRDKLTDYTDSLHLLEFCGICGCRDLKGKDVVEVFNGKDRKRPAEHVLGGVVA